MAGLALCTHILAQSDPQVRTSAPLPRHTKLSQNSQQSGKPKKKIQLKLGTPPVERPDSPQLFWPTPALHVPQLLAAVLVRSIVLVLALYVDQLLNVLCEVPTS